MSVVNNRLTVNELNKGDNIRWKYTMAGVIVGVVENILCEHIFKTPLWF